MTDISWRKNLYTIFLAQLIAVMGTHFVIPFMPLLVQSLGNFNNREAALWAGIATGISGITMFFSAPLWGIVADRYGREPMVLRSLFGTALIVVLYGFAPNIYVLLLLRFFNGILSGILSTPLAMVSTTTPKEKIPFAMGLIAVAYFGGTTTGPLIGGTMADRFGFRDTFFITAVILFIGGLMVLFFTREKFVRPEKAQSASLGSVWRLAFSKQMLPIIMVEFSLQASPQMLAPIIPLVVKELNPGAAAATNAGLALGFMGVISGIASLVTGRLSGHVSLKKILVFSCLAGALLYLPPIWAGTVVQLIVFVALTGVPKGGLITSASAIVGTSMAQSQQGMAYGIAQSAKSLGGGIGPLLGGSLGRLIGLRPVFAVAAGLFALSSVLVSKQLTEEPAKKLSHNSGQV